jgi:hypothetical protein
MLNWLFGRRKTRAEEVRTVEEAPSPWWSGALPAKVRRPYFLQRSWLYEERRLEWARLADGNFLEPLGEIADWRCGWPDLCSLDEARRKAAADWLLERGCPHLAAYYMAMR